ncbi:MAG TPA: response regulator, partial [Bacillaceae bacterium]|nr:response regulator [Bacillaceae bacterium]
MINIVVAEDQQMLLTTLVSLLNLEENIEVVGKAGNGIEAMSLVQQHQPDLCIMDLEMPLKTGLDVAEELKTY